MMNKTKMSFSLITRSFIGFAVVFSFFTLSGCLATTQNFKTGEVLKAGKYQNVFGVGLPQPYFFCEKEFENSNDTCVEISKELILPVGTGFRLGLRDEWGPFMGAELGYYFQVANSGAFDLTLALPKTDSSIGFYHSIALGWQWGFWTDNSWFMEYALSKKWGATKLFANYRGIIQSTSLGDLAFEDTKSENNNRDIFTHNRSWVNQLTTGIEWDLPEIYIIPDVIHISFFYQNPTRGFNTPLAEQDKLPQSFSTFNLGMKWNY